MQVMQVMQVMRVMRSATPRLGLGLALALGGLGCKPDTAVFVEARITAPSIEVQELVLGTALAGGFELSLHLGDRASGPSTVTLDSFRIVAAGGAEVVVDPLPVDTVLSFPTTVTPGSTVTAAFVLDTGADLLPAETQGALCAAGDLQIVGSITDSLQSGSTPVQSEKVAASGCP